MERDIAQKARQIEVLEELSAENWKVQLQQEKEETVQAKVHEELLTRENAVLKAQEGEEEGVLLLAPDAKAWTA